MLQLCRGFCLKAVVNRATLVDDDDDDADDDDKLFLWNDWPTSGIKPYLKPGTLSEILIVANFWQAACRI